LNPTFFITPLVLIAVVLFVAWPLLKLQREETTQDNSALESAVREKEALLSGLKDLEMDYRMGKLSEEDYRLSKSDLEIRALKAIERVDFLRKSPSGKG